MALNIVSSSTTYKVAIAIFLNFMFDTLHLRSLKLRAV